MKREKRSSIADALAKKTASMKMEKKKKPERVYNVELTETEVRIIAMLTGNQSENTFRQTLETTKWMEMKHVGMLDISDWPKCDALYVDACRLLGC